MTDMLAVLKEQGFDESYEVEGGWRPKCSQCEVLVINGVACHELKCPNIPKKEREDFEEYLEEIGGEEDI